VVRKRWYVNAGNMRFVTPQFVASVTDQWKRVCVELCCFVAQVDLSNLQNIRGSSHVLSHIYTYTCVYPTYL
jgi:hypothetical protein